MKVKDYNLNWDDYFEYSEESPSGLVWKIPRYFNGTPNYDRVGQPVGSISVNNKRKVRYWVVGLGEKSSKKTYVLHRIIWILKNGAIHESLDIDHLDQDGLNNKIENLRCVSKSVNSRNKSKRSDNTSGICGVSYETTRTSEGWKAVIVGVDGKKHTKYYSVLKYGDSAKDLAVEWRKLKMEELGQAEYTEIHGV